MSMRRVEIDIPAETYERLRAWAKQTSCSTSQAACSVMLVGFQALVGIGEGAQETIDARKSPAA